jgi:CHAT domain-containing protein
LGRK